MLKHIPSPTYINTSSVTNLLLVAEWLLLRLPKLPDTLPVMLTEDILLDDGVPCIEVDLKWQNNSVWLVFLGLMIFLNNSISLEILFLLLVWKSCFSENICKITFMDSYLLLLYTVDSRYLKIEGTLLNTSRYPYFDISDL